MNEAVTMTNTNKVNMMEESINMSNFAKNENGSKKLTDTEIAKILASEQMQKDIYTLLNDGLISIGVDKKAPRLITPLGSDYSGHITNDYYSWWLVFSDKSI